MREGTNMGIMTTLKKPTAESCRELQDSQEHPGLHPGRLPQPGPTLGWTRDRAPVTIARVSWQMFGT